MLKRLVVGILFLVAGLVAVLCVRAAMYRPERRDVVAPVSFTPASGAIERLAGAIRIPTVSPSDSALRDSAAFRTMRDYMAQTFPLVHAALSRDIVGKDALLYEWKGSDPSLPPVVLLGHIDVVPVDPPALPQWKHQPFSGDIDSGFVWGRGTLDDKATVIGLMEAAETLLSAHYTPKRTVYFAFGADEEVGGGNGAAKIAALLKTRGIKPMMVLDEGGTVVDRIMPGVNVPVAVVGISEKGYASIEISAKGEGGHSSMPPRHTAAGVLARAISRLEDHPLPADIRTETASLLDALGRQMSFGRRVLFANRWLLDPVLVRVLAASPTSDAMLRTTTAVTMLEGRPKDNVLPSVARAVVNFRIVPGETTQSVIAHVKEVIDDPRVEVKPAGETFEPSRVSSTNDSAWTGLDKTIRQIYPEAVVAPYMVMGATDSRYYRDLTPNVYRFTGERIDIDDRSRVHGTNERIAVQSYLDGVRFVHQLILNLTQ
jgi:carboxypeptidase PM20D1